MTELSAADFPAFFRAVHGSEPFPWQQRLARRVMDDGIWPSLLELPTGAGKTAAIDIAVFHLACEAGKGPERKAPMRILFVVDRRIVVDEATRRARKIAEALRRPSDRVLEAVARSLSALAGDDVPPLDVARLRGGAPLERDWARSPAQPLVVISTVDQVGSRLLFRGYGVSPRMSPVHAGLVGADALWLLDEVHLSRPLSETLDAIAVGHDPEGGGVFARVPRISPFGVVRLSATPDDDVADRFTLAAEDRSDGRLAPRLAARKITRVETVDDDLPDAFARHALGFVTGEAPATAERRKAGRGRPAKTARAGGATARRAKRVAVVINTVDLARQVFVKIGRALEQREELEADVRLLTGRVRPLDRDRILAELRPLFADPARPEPERPIILVATQTIEAGADLDLDALVTEVAPLDALRQRFGRLDRLGLRGESRATVLAARSADRWKTLEHIYASSAKETADWLGADGEIDFGIDAFQPRLDSLVREPERHARLRPPAVHAPVLLPPYVDLWAATSPIPAATPAPELFLHGPGTSADVEVVWRADIDPEEVERARISLTVCPPSSLEAMAVPIWAVRRWLAAHEGLPFADAPQRDVPQGSDEDGASRAPGRLCLRRDGDDWVLSDAAGVRPGDTIVIPSTYGGCDTFGWGPDGAEEVRDLGAESHYRQRLRGALRVTRAVLANASSSDVSETWRRIVGTVLDEEALDGDEVRERLLDVADLPDTWTRLLGAMRGRRVRATRVDDHDVSAGVLIWSDLPLDPGLLDPSDEDEEASGHDAITDREDSSRVGVEVTLIDHLSHVEAKARDFAGRAGLPPSIVSLVALAGRLHDLGKADPRFQADLRGQGALAHRDPALAALILAGEGKLLAKSAHRAGTRWESRAAPRNFRHEALSVALAGKHPALADMAEDDRDLVLWLVGTHHGNGRPFFPPSMDEAPTSASAVELDGALLVARAEEAPLRLDQGWFERTERLVRTYGPWELARLEAVVRLADHAASAAEQGSEMGSTGAREPVAGVRS